MILESRFVMSTGQDRGASNGGRLAGLFVIDDQQRLVEWSDAAAVRLGIPAEQATGRPCYEVIQGCDSFGRPVCRRNCAAFRALQRGRLAGGVSFLVRRQASAPLRLRCELSTLPDAPGGAIGRLSEVGRGHGNGDAQPQARPASRDTVGDLAALATLTTSLSINTLEQGLDRALDILREATGAESAELFLVEPASQDLLLISYRGPFHTAFFQRVRFSMGEGFPGLATARQESILTSVLSEDPRYLRAQVVEKGFRSYLCVPMRDSEGVLGALCLGSRRVDLADTGAERLLTWAAAPISVALRAGMLRAREHVTDDECPPDIDGDRVLDHLLRAVLRNICSIAHADGGTVVLLDEAGEGIVRRVSEGISEAEVCPLPQESGAVGRCPALAAHRGISLHGSRLGWPLACRHRHRRGAVTYCLPMRADHEMVGAVQLIYRVGGPSPPTRHLPMLQSMASHAAGLIKRTRDIFEQRRRIEAAYRPSAAEGSDDTAAYHFHDPGSGPSEPLLHIHCLGSFELYRQGRLVTPQLFKRRKALTLLKILLLHAGHSVPRDTLVEALWPEIDPQKGASRLYVVVHALREVLEPDSAGTDLPLIVTEGDGYLFALDARCWLDLCEFQAAIRRGQQAEAIGEHKAALAAYAAGAHLYRGDLLEDEPFAEWCWLEREHLRETYLSVLQRLAGLARDAGELSRAIDVYRRALQVDSLREETHRRLIACLWAAGRRDEALRQYELLRILLRRELDAEPLPETEDLIRRIRSEPSALPRPPLSADAV